jgi:hypothetical protein
MEEKLLNDAAAYLKRGIACFEKERNKMADEITFKRVDLGDGVVFEGEILNGTQFVYGKYSAPKVTYIGEFDKNSDMEGMGKLTLVPDGQTIIVKVGTFRGKGANGLPLLNGIGKEYFNGRLRFAGMYVDGEQHGFGVSYREDGSKQYEGKFAHGRFHGKGVLTKEDGTTVKVEYENGKTVCVDGIRVG